MSKHKVTLVAGALAYVTSVVTAYLAVANPGIGTLLLVALLPGLAMAAAHLLQQQKPSAEEDFLPELHDLAASGDLSRRLSSENAVATAVNGCLEQLQQKHQNIAAALTELNNLALALAANSSQPEPGGPNMDSAIEGIKSSLVATTAATSGVKETAHQFAEMIQLVSENLTGTSTSMDEMNRHMSSVLSASEEMNASLAEVAGNCAHAAQASQSSNQYAEEAQQQMQVLKTASTNIGKVVELINSIANRTNLLALNATIEAASAGDAGRGFAVVANEVKELAKQTTGATKEIADLVESMQRDTAAAMEKIETVATRIGEVNSFSNAIAAAVEQQTATTTEIVSSMTSNATASNDVFESVQMTSVGLEQLSNNSGAVQQDLEAILSSVSELQAATDRAAQSLQQKQPSSQMVSFREDSQQLAALTKSLCQLLD